MSLPIDLVDQFVKATKDNAKTKTEKIVYATVESVDDENNVFVKFDGSNESTRVLTTTVCKPNDRVTVMIKHHTATVTGNMTSPSARAKDVAGVPNLSSDVKNLTKKVGTIEEGLKTANDNISILQGHVMKVSANHVVEYGQSDMWTYEKWNNGKVECWGRYRQNGVNVSDVITVPLPLELLDIPVIFVDSTVRESGSTNSNITLHIVNNNPDQTSVDLDVSIHVIGKYKVTIINEES